MRRVGAVENLLSGFPTTLWTRSGRPQVGQRPRARFRAGDWPSDKSPPRRDRSAAANTNGIDRLLQGDQGRQAALLHAGRLPHALERRLGSVVAAPHARADALLGHQFHRGQKQILQQPEVRIHRVDGGQGGFRVIAHVAEDLADMRPVFLLDMGVVVFLVGPAPRELNAPAPQ